MREHLKNLDVAAVKLPLGATQMGGSNGCNVLLCQVRKDSLKDRSATEENTSLRWLGLLRKHSAVVNVELVPEP